MADAHSWYKIDNESEVKKLEKELAKYKQALKEIMMSSSKDGLCRELDTCYVIARNALNY